MHMIAVAKKKPVRNSSLLIVSEVQIAGNGAKEYPCESHSFEERDKDRWLDEPISKVYCAHDSSNISFVFLTLDGSLRSLTSGPSLVPYPSHVCLDGDGSRKGMAWYVRNLYIFLSNKTGNTNRLNQRSRRTGHFCRICCPIRFNGNNTFQICT